MAFPPGETIVDVEYQVWTNRAHDRVFQQTSFNMASGRFWKGNMEEVVVTVHLPTEYEEFLLGMTWPANHELNDNLLRWQCTDCKPGPYDPVIVDFMPPELLSELRLLERREKADTDNAEFLLELAHKYLQAASKRGPEIRYDYPDFAKLAEIRLERLLEIDPSNCEAWQLYLRNYYRMRRNSCGGGGYEKFEIRDKQRVLVERAYDNCPHVAGIRMWHNLTMEGRWEPLEEFEYTIREHRGEPRIVLIDSGRRRMPYLSPREEKILARYYKRTESENGKGVYTLKLKKLSERDKWKIVRILEKRHFYRYENTDSLRQYYQRRRPGAY